MKDVMVVDEKEFIKISAETLGVRVLDNCSYRYKIYKEVGKTCFYMLSNNKLVLRMM